MNSMNKYQRKRMSEAQRKKRGIRIEAAQNKIKERQKVKRIKITKKEKT